MIPCHRLSFPLPAGELPVGAFCWGDEMEDGTRHLYIVLPGNTAPDALAVFKGKDRSIPREWGWDGDLERPTLEPSILDQAGKWHGHLRAGVLVDC